LLSTLLLFYRLQGYEKRTAFASGNVTQSIFFAVLSNTTILALGRPMLNL